MTSPSVAAQQEAAPLAQGGSARIPVLESITVSARCEFAKTVARGLSERTTANRNTAVRNAHGATSRVRRCSRSTVIGAVKSSIVGVQTVLARNTTARENAGRLGAFTLGVRIIHRLRAGVAGRLLVGTSISRSEVYAVSNIAR